MQNFFSPTFVSNALLESIQEFEKYLVRERKLLPKTKDYPDYQMNYLLNLSLNDVDTICYINKVASDAMRCGKVKKYQIFGTFRPVELARLRGDAKAVAFFSSKVQLWRKHLKTKQKKFENKTKKFESIRESSKTLFKMKINPKTKT